jgi:hypothetical protein
MRYLRLILGIFTDDLASVFFSSKDSWFLSGEMEFEDHTLDARGIHAE